MDLSFREEDAPVGSSMCKQQTHKGIDFPSFRLLKETPRDALSVFDI
jgi:hypothetical protein